MRSKILLAVCAAGALALGTAGTAVAAAGSDDAAAAPACTVSDAVASPSTVAVGISEIKFTTVTFTTDDACTAEAADVTFLKDGVPVAQRTARLAGHRAAAGGFTVNVGFDPAELSDTDAGALTSTITLSFPDASKQDADGPNLTLLRYAKVTNDATPEPVVKGRTITVKGVLSRARWSDQKYHGYSQQTVELQYRTTTGSYTDLKPVTTPSNSGNLSTTTTAVADGCYRFTFAGTSTTTPAVGTGDCVDVK